jgi:hypothetical protein
MKEINHELPVMPPSWCGRICRNALSDVCVGHCAEKKDCSYFDLKKGVNLLDLPSFPLEDFLNRLSPDERKTIMAVYTAKIADHLQGKETNEQPLTPPRRRSSNYSSGDGKVPEDLASSGIQTGTKEENTIYQVRENHPDQEGRP